MSDPTRNDARVTSVNVGPVREVEWRGQLVRTAIWKHSCGTEPVAIRGVNLVGDDQADRELHGGPDKAVYAYAEEDYAHWASAEGVATEPGLFGENLTVRGMELRNAVVGERWRVGTATLEVAQPRLPCYKLGVRMDDPQFPRKFMRVARGGAYLRIVEEGAVKAGDEIVMLDRPTHGVTLGRMYAALGDRSLLPSLLAAPRLPGFWRRLIADASHP